MDRAAGPLDADTMGPSAGVGEHNQEEGGHPAAVAGPAGEDIRDFAVGSPVEDSRRAAVVAVGSLVDPESRIDPTTSTRTADPPVTTRTQTQAYSWPAPTNLFEKKRERVRGAQRKDNHIVTESKTY